MEIKIDLSDSDIELLNAYRILSNYEGYNFDLDRFLNTKDPDGNRYENSLQMLLDTLSHALQKAKETSNPEASE